ncbi:PAS domain-containing protein [Reichenbachiella carrageenanivorans]|uniref:histidine kinase n=1 Tax=Reichenbachiella carrageenanivorans TaxID=2979869 RepID=A0ABY6D0K5_9BACT|nr:PAS domain-containing protein [Reichenbachiella carrageenanivorans]UXX79711.1 PAS domain-containing protein [Reichenbachiella carrageenanivorans]
MILTKNELLDSDEGKNDYYSYSNLSLLIALFVVMAGVMILLGWVLDVEVLKRPTSGLVAVNPMTAICFVLSGGGIIGLLKKGKFDLFNGVVKMVVLLLFIICLIKVVNLITQSEFQIDHVICTEQLMVDMEKGKLNSMAPNTVLGFLLFAMALVLSAKERAIQVANWLAATVFVVGFFSVIGYLYRVGEFRGILAFLPMSFYTAIGFILISVGLLFINSNSGFMKVINSPYSGGRVAKRLIPLIIIIPVLFGYLRILMESNTAMSTELGISILIGCIIVALLITTWFLIRVLNRRDKIQESLRQTQEQFRSAFEFSAIGMALVSTSGKWLSINKKLSEIIGYPKGELEKMTFQDITHPEDLERDMRQVQQLIAGEIDGYQMEKRYFHKDGHLVWALLSVSLVRDGAGRPLHFVSQIENITQRKEAEIALKSVSSRLKLATQAAKIGIWEFDVFHETLNWDNTMYSLYGITKESFSGEYQIWRNGVHPEDLERVDQEVAAALSGEKKFDTEFRIVWPDLSVHHIRALALVERDDNGQPLRMVGTNWDITADKNYKEALRQTSALAEVAKQEAIASAKAKENFLSTMSHEIRTPLNAILGVTNLLLSEEMKAEHLEHLGLLKFSGENLLALINDILDYNKIDAGKIEFEQIDFDLKKLLTRIKQTQAPKVKEKGLDLILRYDEALPHVFVGDSVRVSQIINNLLSNAIKFTEEGFIKLGVSLVSQEAEQATIHFEIHDTGIGIEKSNQSMIFENFSQASGDTTRKFGGTGLGLAITKKLLEFMGSEIRLDSDLGFGSVFSFDVVLPIGNNEPKPAKSKVKETTFANVADRNIKVLVAEDNRANQIVLEKFLDKWGIKMDFVENGKEAVEKAESEAYDMILMDLQMPEMDGYQATQSIRSGAPEYAKQVPIIALTASAMLDVRKKVKELGMTDFITKPFSPEELYKKIVKYHGAVRVKKTAGLPETAIFQKIMNYTDGDLAFVNEVTDHYLDNYKTFRIQFSEAQALGDMDQLKVACEKIRVSNEALDIVSMDDFFSKLDILKPSKVTDRKMFEGVKTACLEIIKDLKAIKTALS